MLIVHWWCLWCLRVGSSKKRALASVILGNLHIYMGWWLSPDPCILLVTTECLKTEINQTEIRPVLANNYRADVYRSPLHFVGHHIMSGNRNQSNRNATPWQTITHFDKLHAPMQCVHFLPIPQNTTQPCLQHGSHLTDLYQEIPR